MKEREERERETEGHIFTNTKLSFTFMRKFFLTLLVPVAFLSQASFAVE